MENFGLYNKLVTLPLFMGMSKEELEQIVTQTKFDFRKSEPGEIIVKEGEKSGHLLLLADGEIEMQTSADDKGYSVHEFIKAPATLQPERIFGLTQRYSCTLTALTACSLICISKSEMLRLTSESLIFRLNLLNLLSTALQKKNHQGWRSVPQSMDQRLRRFFVVHCTHPGGRKIFKIKMVRLAEELNDSRLRISQSLNVLAEQNLIILSRGKIEIPSVERLIGR